MGANSSSAAKPKHHDKQREARGHRAAGHDQVRGHAQVVPPPAAAAEGGGRRGSTPPDLITTALKTDSREPAPEWYGSGHIGKPPRLEVAVLTADDPDPDTRDASGSARSSASEPVATMTVETAQQTEPISEAVAEHRHPVEAAAVEEPGRKGSTSASDKQRKVSGSGSRPHRDGEYDMNTIRQAKVNVKDRISLFRDGDVALRLSADGRTRPVTGFVRPTHAGRDDAEPATPPPLRTAHSPGQDRQSPSRQPEARQEEAEETPKKKTSSPLPVVKPKPQSHRHTSVPASPRDKSHAPIAEPAVDYDLNSPTGDHRCPPAGQSTNLTRMNTLEYFKQVPRENSLLKGFEKAKPAAALRKRAKPQNRATAARPVSMFAAAAEPMQFGSHPDVRVTMTGSTESLTRAPGTTAAAPAAELGDREALGTLNKRGQKYAMDDAAYETLSRRKKLAGQRLAIGVVDKETERNFLASLKRNLQLKQARAEPWSDASDTPGGADSPRYGRRVNITEMVF